MAYGEVARYTVAIYDESLEGDLDNKYVFEAHILDDRGEVIAAAFGTFAEDAFCNAAIRLNNRAFEARQRVPR